MSATELHLIIPGLCGPLADIQPLKNNLLVKNWIKLLSRSASFASSENVNDVIASIFNISMQGDFPSAAFSMLAQGNYDDSMNYMFADPVHMQADMDHAILTSSVDLGLSDKEADSFCMQLNQHFNQDELDFIKLNKDQWLLSSKTVIQLNTTPLENAIGRNVNFILPKGDDASYWTKMLTEAQMLLYATDINKSRENIGTLSVNSLWLHGSGKLPKLTNCRVESICSNSMVFKGLAHHARCEHVAIPATVDEYIAYLLTNDKTINVLHLSEIEHQVNYSDVNIWLDKLSDTLNLWLYPLLKMANKHNVKIILYPCTKKQYQFTKYDVYKIWRQGNLEQHVSSY